MSTSEPTPALATLREHSVRRLQWLNSHLGEDLLSLRMCNHVLSRLRATVWYGTLKRSSVLETDLGRHCQGRSVPRRHSSGSSYRATLPRNPQGMWCGAPSQFPSRCRRPALGRSLVLPYALPDSPSLPRIPPLPPQALTALPPHLDCS